MCAHNVPQEVVEPMFQSLLNKTEQQEAINCGFCGADLTYPFQSWGQHAVEDLIRHHRVGIPETDFTACGKTHEWDETDWIRFDAETGETLASGHWHRLK